MLKKAVTKRNPPYLSFGRFLQEARLKAGLTQRFVSEKLKFGSSQYVSNMERGLTVPPLKSLNTLKNLYRVSAEEVVEAFLAARRSQLEEGLKKQRDSGDALQRRRMDFLW